MEDDDLVAQFTGITGATTERAIQYIQVSEGNIEQAVQLFFETGGVELGDPQPPAPQTNPQPPTRTTAYEDHSGIIHVDSDDDVSDDADPSIASLNARSSGRPASTAPVSTIVDSSRLEEDEAMARRLQEEMYSGGSFASTDPEGVRAPMARTTETLVGPGSAGPYGEDDIQEIMAQVTARRQGVRSSSRPGIFNQRQAAPSIWTDDSANPSGRREQLSRATGGASETSSKSSMLAEMYRPPFEIMSRVHFEEGRDEGRQSEKWLLVNIQDPSVFDCQVLNRDLWKDRQIQETVRENFIFMQYNKDDLNARQYLQYYFQTYDSQDSYPHIAIIDPRTGEQVKVWSGPPIPQANDFLMQLHEFLDRYSLKHNVRNPVAIRKPDVKKEKKLDMMTEEEMFEMALQNSLATETSNKQEDPDDLTRSVGDLSKGKNKVVDLDEDGEMQNDSTPPATNGHEMSTALPASPFSSIPSDRPHIEPEQDSSSTRVQFRHSGGRVIRRFALTDPVRRIYEWLKASPLEGKEGVEFELVFMTKNLIDVLEDTIEGAGLKNGTVMIEFLED